LIAESQYKIFECFLSSVAGWSIDIMSSPEKPTKEVLDQEIDWSGSRTWNGILEPSYDDTNERESRSRKE
jgi:hypothetical protein